MEAVEGLSLKRGTGGRYPSTMISAGVGMAGKVVLRAWYSLEKPLVPSGPLGM
jgi:hypothetical protein